MTEIEDATHDRQGRPLKSLMDFDAADPPSAVLQNPGTMDDEDEDFDEDFLGPDSDPENFSVT